MKIRIGNDFKAKWAITWLGEPEDFSDATDMSLFFNIYDKKIELTKDVDYTITDNIIEIDVTPDICNILGIYNLELHYTKPNDDFIDGERRSAVDIDAFRIVGKSEKADSTQDVSIISDAVAIFLDIAYKKLEEIEANEDVRITNEGEREDAEDIRISNEQDRQTNTTTAISNAEQATLNANNSAVYANEQGSYANEQGAYAEEMSSHPPTIINDYWHIWNFTTNQYETTGQYARGDSAVEGALVAQTTGQSAVNTMSQKAVTDELAQLAGDLSLLRDDATVKLTNLIENGNFIESTGWALTGGASIQNGELVLQGSVSFLATKSHNYIINNSYYFRAVHESTSDTAVSVSLRSGGSSVASGSLPANVGKDTRSFILTPISATPTFLQISRANAGTYGTIIIDDIMVIDLTETFGVGNEPTAVEMDALIEILGINYFEGEKTIAAQKVMQWQQKVITEKSEKPVTPNDTTFIKDSPNLFKKEGIKLGYDLSISDGEEFINSSTAITDFIEFEGAGALVGTLGVSIGAFFYDENKAFLDRLIKPIQSINFYNIPLGSRYVRFRVAIVNVDVAIMVNEGSVLLPYEPYGLSFTKKVIGISASDGGLDDFIIYEGGNW